MNTNTNHDQEIDLGKLVKHINQSISSFTFSIFRFLLFIKKNIIALSIIGLIGVFFGYYIDNNNKKYYSEIIVSPNFGSTEYLYSKVDLLSTKISEDNIAFMNSIGIKNPENIISIKISPIIDIYSLINNNTKIATNAQNTQNFEMMKLLAENSDINKVMRDDITSKNYPLHSIKITTINKINEKDAIEPILKYLNNNSFYLALQKTILKNTEIKITKNQEIINQIDALLNGFSSSSSNSPKNDKLVYYNENTQLNDIIESKNKLIEEIAQQELSKINYSQTIKKTALIINNINKKGINGKMKLLFPFVLFFLFLLFHVFKLFYDTQKKKIINP
ncbi:MAG: hypothetical protein ACOVKJ_03920 [Flavobacterium sp.]